jgi:antitoxin (DNA-binding transcriptional repressor) of toxin-antitoxin stability system
MRGKKPVAKIVAINEPSSSNRRQIAGMLKGVVTYDDCVFDPLTDAELVEYGFDDLLEGQLIPPPAR